MNVWVIYSLTGLIALLSAIALFFFVLTRGALLVRQILPRKALDTDHIYPIYSSMPLIRMIDFQPIISAILLFQYHRLVSAIVQRMQKIDFRNKDVLITSCAFGNVIPRTVAAAIEGGAKQVLIADIIKNELDNAERKLLGHSVKLKMLQENAVSLTLPDESVSVNVIFFLLHELPHSLKGEALREAVRVLEPGGTLFLAEFHKPERWVLRALSWTYFKVFEPLGLALWDTHDPLRMLEENGGLKCERRTYFCGNFQVLVATKQM